MKEKWVIGHSPFMGVREIVAVNLSKADCIYTKCEKVIEDGGKESFPYFVKVVATLFDETDEIEQKTVVDIAELKTHTEANAYVENLIKNLNSADD